MATDSFKFWYGYMESMDSMSDEQAGKLIKALGHYVFDGVEPEIDDAVVRAVFLAIRGSALESKEISAKAREGGKRSGQTRRRRSGKGASEGGSEGGSEACPNVEKRSVAKSNVATLSHSDSSAAAGARGALAGARPAAPPPDPMHLPPPPPMPMTFPPAET